MKIYSVKDRQQRTSNVQRTMPLLSFCAKKGTSLKLNHEGNSYLAGPKSVWVP